MIDRLIGEHRSKPLRKSEAGLFDVTDRKSHVKRIYYLMTVRLSMTGGVLLS